MGLQPHNMHETKPNNAHKTRTFLAIATAQCLGDRIHHEGARLEIAVGELVELGPALRQIRASLLDDRVEASEQEEQAGAQWTVYT